MKKILSILFTINFFIASGQYVVNNDGVYSILKPCKTESSRANVYNFKCWCWVDLEIPLGTDKSTDFAGIDLSTSSENSFNNVSIKGDWLKFNVDPLKNASDPDYNYRGEISDRPWPVDHAEGVEQWIGFKYKFSYDYKIDVEHPFIMYQSHNGTVGINPLISMWVVSGESTFSAGEINVVHTSTGTETFIPTGITPVANDILDVVIHIIWGDENDGVYQVWINGNKVSDFQGRTVLSSDPRGGNSKFGIYKWRWGDLANINESASNGITDLTTYMGSLRMISRAANDPLIGVDESADFDKVDPSKYLK